MRCADTPGAASAAVSPLIWVRHLWTGSQLDWGSPYTSSSSACFGGEAPSSRCTTAFAHILPVDPPRPPGVVVACRTIAVHLICCTQSLHLFCAGPLVQSSRDSRKCNVSLHSCTALKFNISFARQPAVTVNWWQGCELWPQQVYEITAEVFPLDIVNSKLPQYGACSWSKWIGFSLPSNWGLFFALHLEMSVWGEITGHRRKLCSLLYSMSSFCGGVEGALLKRQRKKA